MITLTTPPTVNSILGGSAPVGYDKFILAAIQYNTVTKFVTAQVRLTSTAAPTMQPITGSLQIDGLTAKLTIEVQQLDFYRQVTLTGPQNQAVQDLITTAQTALEQGLIGLAIIAGTHSTGV